MAGSSPRGGRKRKEQEYHSPPRTSQEDNVQSPSAQKAAGTSAGAAGSTSSVVERSLEKQEMAQEEPDVALTRSDFSTMMQMALINIQDGIGGNQGEPFAEMEEAITGLMDLYFKKAEHPLLPKMFVTKWPHDADDPWSLRVMADPVILASGFSVDKSYQKWQGELKNTCAATEESLSHHLISPHHVLRDMISAWCHDYLITAPSIPAEAPSFAELPPLEEQMAELLEKLSGPVVLQSEALDRIYLFTKTSKGTLPSLDQWPDLFPKLIYLHKNWKSTWTQQHEEERLSIILNLSVHGPSKNILAMQEGLPDALMYAANKTINPLLWVMIGAVTAILSEYEAFRRRVVDAGIMTLFRRMLSKEDIVVRKEVCLAMLALCTDDATIASAVTDGIPYAVLDCLRGRDVADECLLLLKLLSSNQCAMERIGDEVEQLMNVIAAKQTSGLFTSRGIEAAVFLIYDTLQGDAQKLKNVMDLEKCKVSLRKLISQGLKLQALFQLGKILSLISEVCPD